MALILEKETGYTFYGNTPDFTDTNKWIINPSEVELNSYPEIKIKIKKLLKDTISKINNKTSELITYSYVLPDGYKILLDRENQINWQNRYFKYLINKLTGNMTIWCWEQPPITFNQEEFITFWESCETHVHNCLISGLTEKMKVKQMTYEQLLDYIDPR